MKTRSQIIAENVRLFSGAAAKYGDNIYRDYDLATQHFNDYNKALAKLSTYGDEGLSALAKLLDDDNERLDVRVMAGMHLMLYATDKAIKVLNIAKNLNRGISMLAIAALKKWEMGFYLDPATGTEVRRGSQRAKRKRTKFGQQ
jgi:hypothetical protein